MEDGLGASKSVLTACVNSVLILVLVEDGLGALVLSAAKAAGRTVLILVLMEDGLGVFPDKSFREMVVPVVLILVLMEDGLGGPSKPATDAVKTTVLILVLMEDGLGVNDYFERKYT